MKNRILIITGVAITLLITIGIIINTAVSERWFQDSGTVRMVMVPDRATLKYDGQTQSVEHGEDLKLEPREYAFTFQRQGFTDYTTNVSVEKDTVTELVVIMNAESEEAKKELEKVKYRAILEGIAGIKLKKDSQQAAQEYKLMNDIPFTTRDYTVYFCDPDELDTAGPVKICIRALGEASYNEAEKTIKSFDNYESEKYVIVDGIEYDIHID